MNNFAKNLYHLRKRDNITQQELASRLKKANTTIGNWENGLSEPNIEELLKLSNIFGVVLQDLVEADLENGDPVTKKKVGKAYVLSKKNEVNEDQAYFGSPVLAELKKINTNIEELRVLVDKRMPKSRS
jgi:transcriptional regulator with XRE-family HTH domain